MDACEHKGFYKRSKLPHFDEPFRAQFITYRLADSLPLEARIKINELPLAKRTPRIQQLLDQGNGQCWLRIPALAAVVQENLLHFDGERYFALAWCIMPNHVHKLIHVRTGFSLPRIVQGWKSYTSKACNNLLGRTGEFWQEDYFDTCAVDEQQCAEYANYIEFNPVAAGMCQRPEDYVYSSAGYRGVTCY